MVDSYIRLRDSIGDDKDAQERLQRLKDSLPMKRITEPSDVANACWYLGTDQSSFVTGTILSVSLDFWSARMTKVCD